MVILGIFALVVIAILVLGVGEALADSLIDVSELTLREYRDYQDRFAFDDPSFKRLLEAREEIEAKRERGRRRGRVVLVTLALLVAFAYGTASSYDLSWWVSGQLKGIL